MKPNPTSFIRNLTKRFSERKTRLPHYWPSPLHNKCSNRLCQYPNPPQVNEGSYRCDGHAKNEFFCSGTYHIDLHRARQSDLYWRRLFSDESEYYAQLSKLKRRKEDSEKDRQRVRRQYLIDEEGRKQASAEAAMYYAQLRAKKRQEREQGVQSPGRWRVARCRVQAALAMAAAECGAAATHTTFALPQCVQDVQTTHDSRVYEANLDRALPPLPLFANVTTTQYQPARPAWASRPLPRAVNKRRPQLTLVI